MFIATCWLVAALALLWVIVRTTDGLARFFLRQDDRPRLTVQLWALFLLPGALVRLLFRVLTARLLRVRTTHIGIGLPRQLTPEGTLPIDEVEIEPTDVLRESVIEMVPAIAGSVGALAACLVAGFALSPGANGTFVRDLPVTIFHAFHNPVRALIGIWLLIAVSTAMARPGPLGRRSWLVSLIAPVLLVLALLALGAWPLSTLPPIDWLQRLLRATTQSLLLASLFDGVILAIVLGVLWLRGRRSHERQIALPPANAAPRGPTGTASLDALDADTTPVPYRQPR
jgi:hypothetical protein